MALSVDVPIEDLKLSKRVRNVLHLSGLHTIGSVLKCDYKTTLRGFGPGARAELASALEYNGFTPPANLNPSEIDNNAGEISKLFGQMERSFEKWNSRIEHFEARIRKLTAKESTHHRPATELAEDAHETAATALASEFRTRLRALRSASAALPDVTKLSPQEQEMVVLVEEESIRLSLLAGRFIEMLPSEKLLPRLCGSTSDARQGSGLRTYAAAQLAAEPDLPPPKPTPAAAVRLDEIPCPSIEDIPEASRPHV